MTYLEMLKKLSNRKYVGSFLKTVIEEYDQFKENSSITFDNKHLQYDLENIAGERLSIDFIVYPTAWRVTIKSKKYSSTILGIFENVDETFSIGTKLVAFLNGLKMPATKNVPSKINEKPFSDILEKLRSLTKSFIEDNIDCTKNVFNNGVEKEINSLYLTFKPDRDQINLVNLFRLFKKIDTDITKDVFIKELALYIVAKHIIDSKNETFNNVDPQPFEIEAQSQPICYAHTLQFYGGKCKYLHGHNGILTIKANLKPDTISKRPMFLSYGFLKSFLKYVDKQLDHKTFWALNKNDLFIKMDEGYRVETPKQIVIFKDLEGVTIFPYMSNSVAYSTSEVTLYNYVIPQFLIFLIRFMINDSGPDNTSMAINEFTEPIRYSFKWNETDTTVCTVTIDC